MTAVSTKKVEVKAAPKTEYYDQIAYAIGSDPTIGSGAGAIVHESIKNELEPVWDYNFSYEVKKVKDSVIAFRTPDASLWIVGAAVFGGLGVAKLKQALKEGEKGGRLVKDSFANSYASQGDFLPHAGRPPEGIPILSYALAKLTGHVVTGADLNLNKANPTDLFAHFSMVFKKPKEAKQTDFDDLVRDMVQSFLNIRADTKFVVDEDDVAKMLGYYKQSYGLEFRV